MPVSAGISILVYFHYSFMTFT